MNPIFDYLIDPYRGYGTVDILLEALAVVMGLLSVWYAKRDHIAVYPTGMLSTAIFVYLLLSGQSSGGYVDQCLFFFDEHLRLVFLGKARGRNAGKSDFDS